MAGIKYFALGLLSFYVGVTATSCYAFKLQLRSDDPDPLEAVVMRQSQTIDQLQAQLTSVQTNFQTELASVKTNFQNEIASLQARLAEQETKVAFNVRLSVDKHFVDDNILVCDVVDLNQGGGYDKTTGVFTAPVSGLYVFSVKVTHTPPGNIHAIVLKNGVEIAEAEAEGQTLDRSSATVAVQLAKGDRVWVMRQSDSTATELQGDWRTMFTGFLVRPDRP